MSLEGHLQTKLRAVSRWLVFFIVSEVFFHYHVCCSYTSPWFDLILNTVPTCLIVLLRRASSCWRNYNDELRGLLAVATQRKRTSFHSLIVVKLELWVYCTTTFMVNTLKNCWNWFRLFNTLTRHPNVAPPLTLSFVIPRSRTRHHQKSFFPRSVRRWNSLPPSVFPDKYNLAQFKRNVNNYITLQYQ